MFSLRASESASLAEATASLAQTSASLAQSSADRAFDSASAYSASQFEYTNQLNNQINDDLSDVISGSTAIQNGSGATFIDAGIIYSPNIGGTNGYFSNAFRVGENGITLDGTNSRIYVGNGSYDSANTPFYFASGSSNIFSLGNKLSWNGSNLTIEGSITLTNPGDIDISDLDNSTAGFTNDDAAENAALSASNAQSDADTANNTISSNQAQWSAGEANPSNYSFGPDADFDLTTFTPSGTGLYLGSTEMGYYNSGWKTYMNDDGQFFLGGFDGALKWDGSDLNIEGAVKATSGEFTGTITAQDGTIANFEISTNRLATTNDIFSISLNIWIG